VRLSVDRHGDAPDLGLRQQATADGGVRDELQALADAGREVDHPAALGASAERLRALVRKSGIPARIRADVLAASHRMGDAVAVAVRSSARGEDTADAPFAGMYDTSLNVVGDDALVDRVIDCWVSLYGARLIAYRTSRGLMSGRRDESSSSDRGER
jgi:pyruvate, water dikinase